MKVLCLLSALLFSVGAHAAESKKSISEYQEHAMGGQIEVTPRFTYDSVTADLVPSGKVKTSGIRLGSEFEYGVMERLSVGADLSYTSWTQKTEPATTTGHLKGLDDVKLFTRGSSEMGAGRLAYGADLGISLGKAESKNNGDNTSRTGGLSLTPYVGYEMNVGTQGIWGAQLKYRWNAERKRYVEAVGSDFTQKDGNTAGLSTFYEHDCSEKFDFGAALSYNMTAESKVNGAAANDKHNDLGISLYAPIAAGTNMTVIPRLDFTKLDYKNNSFNTDPNWLSVGAALRWMM